MGGTDEKSSEEVGVSADNGDSSNGDEDLVGGLEALLEEEGSVLGEEEDLTEDDLADVFEDGGEPAAEAETPGPASPRGRRAGARDAREERRSRDRDAFKNLDAQMKLTPLGIKVSEDKLQATISRISPEDTFEDILALAQKHKIAVGLDAEGVRESVARAARTGQTQYDVVVARGKPPATVRQARIVHRLPKEMLVSEKGKKTDFERLKVALEGPHVEAVKSWKGPVRIVRKNDVVAEVAPAELQAGKDVCGDEIVAEQTDTLKIEAGANTSVTEGGQQCVAEIYGYAGLIEGLPTVLPPLWMSEDHMEVRFVYFPPTDAAPPATIEDLQELLDLHWIESGVLEQQLELIQQRLEEKLPLPVTLPVAQGTREMHGESAQIQYAFDPYVLLNWNQIQSIWALPTPEALEQSLKQFYEDEENPARFTGFRRYDTVVEKIPATQGIVGRDVQGEEIEPEEGEDVPLESGDNLTLTEDGLRCVADCFGYVCLRYDVQVTILSPLWIAPDKTAAYYVNLPQTSPARHPSLEDMQHLMEGQGIKHGFSAERWVETLEKLEAGEITDYLVPVAEGVLPQKGRDAEFEWAVDIEQRKPGKILEDGSIDYRERNLTTVVAEGDLLGRLLPPQPGSPGRDIYGNEMRPPAPINIEVITDSRIYAEAEEAGTLAFFSELGGGISTKSELKKVKNRTHRRIDIGIHPISNIDRDVDYTTGNIDFNGDVVIGGSVQPQFSVKATGTVTVGGYVEAGAYITAGQDIIVKRGVVGSSTELVAGGGVMAKYIQEATIRAGGDVKAGSYIFNASIRTRGQIVVVGKGEGKSRALVGGLIWGAQGLTARSIGSPYNTGTRLVAGVDPDQVNRIEQIQSNMQACRQKQDKLMRTIGVPSLDVQLIKQKLARSRSPKDKQSILLGVKRIAKVAELEQNLQKELDAIAKDQQLLSFRASVNVVNSFFAGVELRIGEETLLLHEDKEKVTYRLIKEEEELNIREEPLKGNVRG